MQLHSVSLESSSRCNAKCIMCPNSKIRRLPFMPLDKYKALVDEATEMGVAEVNLTQYGEPLLDPDIVERVAYAAGKGKKVSFFTNGSLMSQELGDQLVDAGLFAVVFSIDSADKATYEKIRVGLDFDRVVQNIQAFCERHKGKVFRRIHSVVMQENFHELDAIMSMWRGKVDMITGGVCEGRNGETILEDRSTKGQCAIVSSAMIVLTDGTAVMCCQDWNGSMPLGNAFDVGLKTIWDGELYTRIRYKHTNERKREIPLCKKCTVTY